MNNNPSATVCYTAPTCQSNACSLPNLSTLLNFLDDTISLPIIAGIRRWDPLHTEEGLLPTANPVTDPSNNNCVHITTTNTNNNQEARNQLQELTSTRLLFMI
jgi:hypothetical protein